MNHLSARYKYEYHLVMVTMETQPDSAPHIESIEEALECMEHVICKRSGVWMYAPVTVPCSI